MDEPEKIISKRYLKVYYFHNGFPYIPIPVIRLGGKYLSNLDFKIGDTIEVVLETGKIVMSKVAVEGCEVAKPKSGN